jgi:hypothetical protein
MTRIEALGLGACIHHITFILHSYNISEHARLAIHLLKAGVAEGAGSRVIE